MRDIVCKLEPESPFLVTFGWLGHGYRSLI